MDQSLALVDLWEVLELVKIWPELVELSPLVLNLCAEHSGFRISLLRANFKKKKTKSQQTNNNKKKTGGYKASLEWSITNKGINMNQT